MVILTWEDNLSVNFQFFFMRQIGEITAMLNSEHLIGRGCSVYLELNSVRCHLESNENFDTMDDPIIFEEEDELEDVYEELIQDYVQCFPPRVPRRFRHRSNPMEDFNDVEFRQRFRISKEVAIGTYIFSS